MTRGSVSSFNASVSDSVSGDMVDSSDALRSPRRDVRPEASGLHHDRLAGLRVLAEFALAAAAEEQLVDLLRGQLVRRDALRNGHPVSGGVAVAVAGIARSTVAGRTVTGRAVAGRTVCR